MSIFFSAGDFNVIIAEKNIEDIYFLDFHFHDEYEFYYLLEGSTNFHIGDGIYKINSGDIVFIPHWILHKNTPNNSNNLKWLVIRFKHKYIEELINATEQNLSAFLSRVNIITKSSIPSIYANIYEILIEPLVWEYFRDSRNDNILLRLQLQTLLITLNRIYNSIDRITFPLVSSAIPEILQKIISQLFYNINNANHLIPTSLKSVSRHFSVSETYITKLFKRYIGVNYTTYILNIKIQKAVGLLLYHKNLKVYEIAQSCGFNDNKHFFKVFKKYMNMSPLQFRKTHVHQKNQDINEN